MGNISTSPSLHMQELVTHCPQLGASLKPSWKSLCRLKPITHFSVSAPPTTPKGSCPCRNGGRGGGSTVSHPSERLYPNDTKAAIPDRWETLKPQCRDLE